MYSPELQTGPGFVMPEELLVEAFDVAKNIEAPLFLHERSDYGHMFRTGNFGGYDKYYANDAYLTPLPFDFSQFDYYDGQSAIQASLFSTDNGNLVGFFNIERDDGSKFTYGLMMNAVTVKPVTELIQTENSDWGKPLDPDNRIRESVYNWLSAI